MCLSIRLHMPDTLPDTLLWQAEVAALRAQLQPPRLFAPHVCVVPLVLAPPMTARPVMTARTVMPKPLVEAHPAANEATAWPHDLLVHRLELGVCV